MLGLTHEHHGPGGVRGRRPRPGRLCSSRRATAERESERRAAFRKLQLAAHWADLHPATTDTGVETFGGPALMADESLGGDGTPLVAAFTPEPFALALGMSPSAGAQLIADALDLRHRLPLLWKRVVGWRCRPGRPAGSPARPTACPKAAAIWVDEQLADRGLLRPRGRRPARRPRHRRLRPRRTRGPGERRPGRLGRHPDPPRGQPTSSAPPVSKPPATPWCSRSSTTRSAASPTSCSSTATPHRLGVRKIKALGILTGQPADDQQAAGEGVRPRRRHRPRDRRRRRLHAGRR